MRFEDIMRVKRQIYQIAAKHGIDKVFVFGSVGRGEGQGPSEGGFWVEKGVIRDGDFGDF